MAERQKRNREMSVAGGEAAPPASELNARNRILAAAEAEFAVEGYGGASLRRIAEKADVPLGLLPYHFKTKRGIYRAIFEARSPAIVEQRRNGLAIARLERDPARRLELILRALLVPMLSLRGQEEKNLFGLLLAREVSDPQSFERGIIPDIFDPIARTVIEELQSLWPERSKASIHWAYQTVIGVMVYFMADTGRIARLSEGVSDPRNVEDTLQHLIPLLLHGLAKPQDGH